MDDPVDALSWIATVYSLPEARCLAAFLRTHDIPVLAANVEHATLNPTLISALGGIRIFVPATAIHAALELLHEGDGGWSNPPTSYSHHKLLNFALALALFVFAIVPPPRVRGLYQWHSPTVSPE